MLQLININKTNEYIEADYIPEDSDSIGHIKLFADGREETVAAPNYGGSYVRMAYSGLKRTLGEIANGEEILKERLVMWY